MPLKPLRRPAYAGHKAASKLIHELDAIAADIPAIFAPVENVRVTRLAAEIRSQIEDHSLAIAGLIWSEYDSGVGHQEKSGGDGVWRTIEGDQKIFITGAGEARGGGPGGPVVGGVKPKQKPNPKQKPKPPGVDSRPRGSGSEGEAPSSGAEKKKYSIPDRTNAAAVRVAASSLSGQKKKVKSWVKSLSADESDSIEDWSDDGYRDMRSKIASGNTTDREKMFLSALAKGGNIEANAYRGLTFYSNEEFARFEDAISSAGVGGEWSDPAPASASTDPTIAMGFANQMADRNVMLKMKVATGTYIDPLSTQLGEKELVLRPASKYRITAISRNQELRATGVGPYRPALFIELEEI